MNTSSQTSQLFLIALFMVSTSSFGFCSPKRVMSFKEEKKEQNLRIDQLQQQSYPPSLVFTIRFPYMQLPVFGYFNATNYRVYYTDPLKRFRSYSKRRYFASSLFLINEPPDLPFEPVIHDNSLNPAPV